MNNIVLIGMPGSGKSTLGIVLAKRLGMDFVDTDILLVKKHSKTLPDLIEEYGFERFIELEGQIGEKLRLQNTVIATGGSMALSEKGMKSLSKNAKVVWLDVPLADLENRFSQSLKDRGVAAPQDATLEQIYNTRNSYYQKYADIRIICKNGFEETLIEIMQKLNQ